MGSTEITNSLKALTVFELVDLIMDIEEELVTREVDYDSLMVDQEREDANG